MGLFSFIKNAGAKVFGFGKTTEEEAAEDPAKAKELASAKAGKLVNAVDALGFEVTDLNITVEGDTATIYGEAEN